MSLSGAFAYQGILDTPTVVSLSAIGTMLSEQISFYVGKSLGARYMHRFPRFHAKIERVFNLIQNNQTLFILTCRFLYGLRTVSPFIMGSAKIDPLHFTFFNAIAAIIWACISVSLGYFGAYTAKQFGYSHTASYFITAIFIITSITILGILLKQLLKTK